MRNRDAVKPAVDGVVVELRGQGLKVSVHDVSNETWFIKGDGLYNGYIATAGELLELKRNHQLNISGIKSLG